MPLFVTVGQATLASPVGPNQDYAGAVTPDERLLNSKGVVLAIADGVGKARGGGELAEASVRSFLGGWYSSPETWSASRCLSTLFVEVNAAARRDHPKAACTLSVAVVVGRHLHVAHVGDSRVWLARGGKIRQLTVDHVWDNPDMRNVLHRAVGLDEAIVPQFAHEELAEGDLLVLATDGYHRSLDPDPQIFASAADMSLDVLCERMVEAARNRGSDDDATVLLARIETLPSVEESRFSGDDSELPPLPNPKEGLEFDGFRLHKKLGGGRLTSVWLADDREGETRVVLKIPDARSVQDVATREEFLREEWVGKRIRHVGVVPVLPLRSGRRKSLYYAMPWTEGTSLRRILSRDGSLDAFTATRLGLEISSALRALHRQGVIHRDVKPDNLLISRQGIVKVADFGIARLQGDVSLTQAGTAMGSPLYMSPEQVEGATLSGKSDVYSLASSLFRMAVGHPPVEAEHVHGIMWRIASQDAPELRASSSAIPKGLSDLVKRMHLRSVDKRPSMEEAAHDLRQWLATQGVLDPAEHLRHALGFPQASTLKPTTGSYAATGSQASHKGATSLIADALGWFKQKFAKAS